MFALRQPCAAVVSTGLPLSVQWTGVRVTFTQWVGVLLLLSMAVAETVAYYRRLSSGHTTNAALPESVNGFKTPKPMDEEEHEGTGEEHEGTKEERSYEEKASELNNFEEVTSETKKYK